MITPLDCANCLNQPHHAAHSDRAGCWVYSPATAFVDIDSTLLHRLTAVGF